MGCNVLDGTTSANDWEGILPAKELPRMKNPAKGYIVSANNRLVPDNVKSDLGATIVSTVRAQRITEMIERHLSWPMRFEFDDLKNI